MSTIRDAESRFWQSSLAGILPEKGNSQFIVQDDFKHICILPGSNILAGRAWDDHQAVPCRFLAGPGEPIHGSHEEPLQDSREEPHQDSLGEPLLGSPEEPLHGSLEEPLLSLHGQSSY